MKESVLFSNKEKMLPFARKEPRERGGQDQGKRQEIPEREREKMRDK